VSERKVRAHRTHAQRSAAQLVVVPRLSSQASPTQPPTTFYDETETNEIISSHSCTLYQCNETSRTSQEDRMPVIPLTRVAGM
jgi:hypothetical protein